MLACTIVGLKEDPRHPVREHRALLGDSRREWLHGLLELSATGPGEVQLLGYEAICHPTARD
jgi:hypothetical protein